MNMYQVVNANAYNGANSLLGIVKELTLPNISFQFQDHRNLGMIGTVQLFSGIEAMEATVTWASLIPSEIIKYGHPRKMITMTCYSDLEDFSLITPEDGTTPVQDTSSLKISTILKGFIKTYPLGGFVPGEMVSDVTTTISCIYVSQSVGTDLITEIDVMNNTYKIGDESVMADISANIGT